MTRDEFKEKLNKLGLEEINKLIKGAGIYIIPYSGLIVNWNERNSRGLMISYLHALNIYDHLTDFNNQREGEKQSYKNKLAKYLSFFDYVL